MNAQDIYTLPDLGVSIWYAEPDTIAAFSDEWSSLTPSAARDDSADELTLHRKISRPSSDTNTVDYIVLAYEGIPFGILIQEGHGDGAKNHRFVSNPDAYLKARQALLKYSVWNHDLTLIAPSSEVDEFSGVAGCKLIATNGKTVLRPRAHLSRDGEILFDEDRFRSAFDEHVRPVFGSDDPEEFARGIKSPLMQSLTRKAIAEALPDECISALTFRPPRRSEPKAPTLADVLALPLNDMRCAWPGVLVQFRNETYLVGLQSSKIDSHFRWVDDLIVEYLGPGDLFDTMKIGNPPRQGRHEQEN